MNGDEVIGRLPPVTRKLLHEAHDPGLMMGALGPALCVASIGIIVNPRESELDLLLYRSELEHFKKALDAHDQGLLDQVVTTMRADLEEKAKRLH